MDYQESDALLDFIRCSPSAYHAVRGLTAMLDRAGFVRLAPDAAWEGRPGSYYTVRDGSALIAFRIPAGGAESFRIAAAHADSPCFKLKPGALKRDGRYLRLNTEPYGGMRLASWLDRPLSLAGRVLVRAPEGLSVRLADVDRDLLVIPSVAIHMERDANDGKKLNPAVDLVPLLSAAEEGDPLPALVASAAGARPENVVDGDLYVYCRDPGRRVGLSGEYLLAPRLDDLDCVWGCVRGFLEGGDGGNSIPVCCVLHNEEVGSATKQGAGSTFLRDTLRRVALALGRTEADWQAMLARSFLVSADNAHAIHPNHPEYADPENAPVMNGGVVLKYSAAQRYATDGVSAAAFRELCRAADVPVQVFANRSDLPGGSTLGSIADTLVPVPTVDIGLAQLAMHSAVETAGAADPAYLVRAMTAYFAGGLALPRDAI